MRPIWFVYLLGLAILGQADTMRSDVVHFILCLKKLSGNEVEILDYHFGIWICFWISRCMDEGVA
jgi:hypothetical protein